jgi:hypothetical protein
VVEHHFKRGGLTGLERAFGAGVNLGLQTTAAEGSAHATVGEEERLGAGALGTGTFDAGEQRESEGLVFGQGVDELIIEAGHEHLLLHGRLGVATHVL